MPEIFDFPESYPASPWIHQAASGHIPHAQLIISQNGGLAWPAVQRYVQSLVCRNGGCGTCDGCIQHRQLAHPDVHYIFPVVASASGSGTKFYNNKFYLLEINTQPGMTNLSLVPEIAAFYGISFIKLLKWILSDASKNR